MRVEPLPHDHPWSSSRVLVVTALALTFALCAANDRPLHAQQTAAPVAVATDSAPTPLTLAQVDSARQAGKALGAKHGGWFGRAVPVGMFTAYAGTVVMVAVAATSDPPLPATAQRELLLRSPAYQEVFQDAYRR